MIVNLGLGVLYFCVASKLGQTASLSVKQSFIRNLCAKFYKHAFGEKGVILAKREVSLVFPSILCDVKPCDYSLQFTTQNKCNT